MDAKAFSADDQSAAELLLGKPVWIFDLDNTLYPADCDLFPQIDVLMGRFIGELLGVESVEARRVQKDLFVRYGTTLKGLMECHDVDPEVFSNYVHDVDISGIEPDPALAGYISALDARCLVFTNASTAHAKRILKHLRIDHLIEGIFDVAQAGYIPKPHQQAYDQFVAHFGFDAGDAVMVDDMARNLVPAAKMGMQTVWLKTGNQWGQLEHSSDHIRFEIDNLSKWLGALTGGGSE